MRFFKSNENIHKKEGFTVLQSERMVLIYPYLVPQLLKYFVFICTPMSCVLYSLKS